MFGVNEIVTWLNYQTDHPGGEISVMAFLKKRKNEKIYFRQNPSNDYPLSNYLIS